ncbi:hypothetical protein ACFQH6_14260 [Halobacteriaceae archaeon GCM10025711]
MNLDELRGVQNRERATDSLQDLRDSFYDETAAYIQGLKEERERAASSADDPFASPEVNRLTDEITMAEQVVEAIYERRVGKIVKHASLAAAGMSGDEEGLTKEERRLYNDLVDRIQQNKDHVLAVLAGETDDDAAADSETAGAGTEPPEATTDAPAPPPDTPPAGEPDVNAADLMGDGQSAEAATGDETAGDAGAEPDGALADEDAGQDLHRTTVRVTRDVGEILGIDERVYRLEADDVVTLPEENAQPLLQREAAERLE